MQNNTIFNTDETKFSEWSAYQKTLAMVTVFVTLISALIMVSQLPLIVGVMLVSGLIALSIMAHNEQKLGKVELVAIKVRYNLGIVD